MSEQVGGELTLKDRLNFPYLIGNQILTFQRAILNLEFSDKEIREAIEGFVHLIPESWKDAKFKEQMEKAIITRVVDIRPEFCGVIASLKHCKENGITPYIEEKVFDYYMVFQACINLLDRLKMLSRIRRIEKLEGLDLESIRNLKVRKGVLQR